MLSLPVFDVVCTSLFIWLRNEQEKHEHEHDIDKILLCCVVLCCVVLGTLGPADHLEGPAEHLGGPASLIGIA